MLILSLKNQWWRGTWVVQGVKCPTLAQVMISLFVSLSPASGSVLTAQSLERASDSVPGLGNDKVGFKVPCRVSLHRFWTPGA